MVGRLVAVERHALLRPVRRAAPRRGPFGAVAAVWLGIVCACLWGSWPSAAAELELVSKSAVLMDYNSGRILFEKDAHVPLPPASVTKIMTLALALEAVQQGRARLDELVTASERAASMGGAQIWLEVGEQMPLRELLLAVAVGSANDAAVAVAEHLAGSEAEFVQLMNQKAAALGMKNTRFANVSGLPPKETGSTSEHEMSAYDIALMSRWALSVPGFLEMVSTYGPVVMRPETKKQPVLYNFNKLLRLYPGADGIKTGMTNEAGYCLSATAVRNQLRLIAVTMGAPSAKDRTRDISRLLDWGFARYQAVPVARAGEPAGQIRVRRGRQERVAVLPERDLLITVAKGEKVQPQTELQLPPGIAAPVKKGQRVGELVVRLGGQEAGRVALVAAQDVARTNLIEEIFRQVRGAFSRWLPQPSSHPGGSGSPSTLPVPGR